MDPVTHTLLGAAVGEAFFRRRWGGRAVAASALAANLPDIDGLVHLTGDPAAIVLRRSFGHSLFLLPLWVAGLAWLLRKRAPDAPYPGLLLLVGVNAVGHLLLDLINSFGVQLLWPLSLARPELAITFIIDLALTSILAAPHLARLSAAWRPRRTAAAMGALAAAGLYLIGSFAARQRALALAAAADGGAASFRYAFPEPFGPRRWRVVTRDGDVWRVRLVDALTGRSEDRLKIATDADLEPAQAARRTALGRRLDRFFKAPVWSVEPSPDGGWTASVRDLRFETLALRRATPFRFVFDVGPEGTAAPRGTKIW